MPRVMLLTKANRAALPELYSQEDKGSDAVAYVKFFTPDAQWTWYATEFDGEDRFFGLVVGQETELGYFSLSELKTVRGRFGLPIERDRYFDPTLLKDLPEYQSRLNKRFDEVEEASKEKDL